MTSSLANLAKTEQLFDAIRNRNYNKAKKLLEEGANPNRLLLNGVTPLHVAVAGESTFSYNYVQLLLDFNGNPNVYDADGLTPLHIAAQWDKADCLSLLLNKGADLSLLDKDGNNILWHAQKSKHCKVIIDEYLKTVACDSLDMDFKSSSSSCTNANVDFKADESVTIPFQELDFNKNPPNTNHFYCDSTHSKPQNILPLFKTTPFENSLQKFSVKDASNNLDKENFQYCENKKLTLDATSPDHCFFVYKSNKREKSVNMQDTVVIPNKDVKLLSDNDLSMFPSSVCHSTCSIASEKHISLFKHESHTFESQAKSNAEIVSISNESSSSSICTFADSTLSVDDVSMTSDKSKGLSDFNLFILSSSTVDGVPSQANDMTDSHCQKMLLNTRYSAHLPEDDATPKTSMSCHNSKKLFFESDNIQNTECSTHSEQTNFVPEKTKVTSLSADSIESATKSSYTFSDSTISVPETYKIGNDIKSSAELTPLKLHLPTETDQSPSPNAVKDVYNAFNSLTLSDASGSSPPIKLSMSTLSLTDVTDSTIIYDWQALADNSSFEQLDSSYLDQQAIPAHIENMNDNELRIELVKRGVSPGPIPCARKQYKKQLHLLELGQTLSSIEIKGPSFSRELESVLCGNSLPQSVVNDDAALRSEFDDPSQSTRGGSAKDSFNYLLLDPRVTKNLPERSKTISESEALKIFAGATFYVGKGKKSRPYAHLKEALRSNKNTKSRKIDHIKDIWETDGVVSLHVFQNVLACEAFTREAAMIEAFGLEHLTNRVRGKTYGSAQTWDRKRLRHYGTFLIIRAMQMLLLEGERQIRPHQITNKQTCKNT